LYWLGESYEGLNLTRLQVSSTGQYAEFWYGEPDPPPAGSSDGWIAPLIINIRPYCEYPPEEYLSNSESPDNTYEHSRVRIGDTDGYLGRPSEKRYSERYGGVTLWSRGSVIRTGRYGLEIDIEKAARALIPISKNGGATPDPFPSSWVSC
jgi:hypothetical protein